jgi:hypothetical protein
MAVASESDNTPLPGTVFSLHQVRVLKVAVIVMGILLVVGFALVVAGIFYQASKLGKDKQAAPEPAAEGTQAELAVPSGATVSSLALDGDRLALHLESSAGPEVLVIDVTTGKVISRIKLKAQ